MSALRSRWLRFEGWCADRMRALGGLLLGGSEWDQLDQPSAELTGYHTLAFAAVVTLLVGVAYLQ